MLSALNVHTASELSSANADIVKPIESKVTTKTNDKTKSFLLLERVFFICVLLCFFVCFKAARSNIKLPLDILASLHYNYNKGSIQNRILFYHKNIHKYTKKKHNYEKV